jgi:hypothetical protein
MSEGSILLPMWDGAGNLVAGDTAYPRAGALGIPVCNDRQYPKLIYVRQAKTTFATRAATGTLAAPCVVSPWTKRNGWFVVPSGAGAKNGTSWADAFAKPSDGATAAANSGEFKNVYVKHGTYTTGNVFSLQQGVHMYGGFKGIEDEDDPLSQRCNPFDYPTILDYTGSAVDIVTLGYIVGYGNEKAIINGMQIKGTASPASNAITGILVNGAWTEGDPPEITNCKISGTIKYGVRRFGGTAYYCSISSCQFVGIYPYSEAGHAIYDDGLGYTVASCLFQAVRLHKTSPGYSVVYRCKSTSNCSFVACKGYAGVEGGTKSGNTFSGNDFVYNQC